ncbi:MAG: hypothetical protein OXU62_08935 [Gammaproteobacteria bacterium]|nr:hypothetical protein [Gammaproteobacteria bacterium]
MKALDYTLLRTTVANVGAALMVTAIVRMVIFEGPTAEAMYLLVGGFYAVWFSLIRRAEQ